MAEGTLRTLGQLVDAGLVDHDAATPLAPVTDRYAVALTAAMQRLITPGDTADPIARQFVPDVREAHVHPDELSDPIGDHPHTPLPGLVHRYPDRVLLKVVSVCPVYCRFCFRREMIGPANGDGMLDHETINTALAYVAEHAEISEVILTGGDPFILSPRRIAALTHAIDKIEHVTRIRWHTRVPVVDPNRITDEFVVALHAPSAKVRVAIHANHHRELTPDAILACERLKTAGISLLSQTVLLRGINNTTDELAHLMRAFVETGIQPYYLHHGDLAPGTAHFRTTIAEGQALMRDLEARLPPDELPAYILDLPGGHGKVAITAQNFALQTDGNYVVSAPDGTKHRYRDCVRRD